MRGDRREVVAVGAGAALAVGFEGDEGWWRRSLSPYLSSLPLMRRGRDPLPEFEQPGGEALGLRAVRRIEVVALGEGVELVVGEYLAEAPRHRPVVVGLLRPPSA